MPRGVADLLQARLDGVGDAARQALQAAAVIGRSFDLEALQATSGRSDEEVISALETLASRGSSARWPRTSARPRGTTSPMRSCASWSTTRRAWPAAGCCTAAVASRCRSGHVSRRTWMPRRRRSAGTSGWPGRTPMPRPAFALAGDHARSLYANAEALVSLSRLALALGHPETCRLHEAIGDMHTLWGRIRRGAGQLRDRRGVVRRRSQASPTLAEIEHKLGNIHARRGEWSAAETHFEARWTSQAPQAERAGSRSHPGRLEPGRPCAGQVERASGLALDALAAAESAR